MLRPPVFLEQPQQQQQDASPTLLRSRGLEAMQQQQHPLLQHKRTTAPTEAATATAAAAAVAAKPGLHWQQQQQQLQQVQQQQQQVQQQQHQRGQQRQLSAQQKQRGLLVPPAATAAAATAASAAAAAGFSSSEQQILREAFAVFDRDGDGLLQPVEFRAACMALGIQAPEPMAAKMLLLEGAADGLSFARFCSFAAERFSLTQAETDADGLFDLLDRHRKGYLTLADLEEAARCCSCGEMYSSQQLELMLRHLSPNESGKVSRQQFKKLFGDKHSIVKRTR
ncbi:hypothetical protein Esti_005027 [Eimeria stiedai]